MHFQDTHTSLPITRAEEHKCARMKVEEGIHPSLEAIWRAEKEEEPTWIYDEEETRLVEEARLKYEEEVEEYARLESLKEVRLVEETREKSEE